MNEMFCVDSLTKAGAPFARVKKYGSDRIRRAIIMSGQQED